MPALIREVVDHCTKNKIPVFPGAFTPQEVYDAWNAGATMVKVFPAAMFGPAYIKELKAPFDKIELLACGGITPDNIKTYFINGSSAVAFGASVFRKEWLEKHDFENIRLSIKKLIDHAK
jgi:2-dehydro-3-deoxyphosphogluconate aldolase/(4S)-4-hydroxy-2-oxoglutarate aldolase